MQAIQKALPVSALCSLVISVMCSLLFSKVIVAVLVFSCPYLVFITNSFDRHNTVKPQFFAQIFNVGINRLLGRRVTALLRRSGKGIISDIATFGDVTVDFSGYTAHVLQ